MVAIFNHEQWGHNVTGCRTLIVIYRWKCVRGAVKETNAIIGLLTGTTSQLSVLPTRCHSHKVLYAAR